MDVYTSTNGLLWDKDAHYIYYDHGPLARVELGDNQVQGLDYAYTLQGWLKGTNSANLSTTSDMGKDSKSQSVHEYFGQDAVSFSLHYFQNDYTAIDNTTPWLSSYAADATILTGYKNLWNGNIGMMHTNIADPTPINSTDPCPESDPEEKWGKLGTVYQYDQLNRLLNSNAYRNSFDPASSEWKYGTYDESTCEWLTTSEEVIYNNQFT